MAQGASYRDQTVEAGACSKPKLWSRERRGHEIYPVGTRGYTYPTDDEIVEALAKRMNNSWSSGSRTGLRHTADVRQRHMQ